MLLLISACHFAWWHIAIMTLVPAFLGWWFRANFAREETAKCKKRIKDIEFELKKCREAQLVIPTTEIRPKVKFSDSGAGSDLNLSTGDVDASSSESSESKSASMQTGSAESANIVTPSDSASGLSQSKVASSGQPLAGASSKQKTSESKTEKSVSKKSAKSEKRGKKGTKTKAVVIKPKYPKLQDNLEVIEGIGPIMKSILVKNGIKTWKELSKKSPASLQKLLNQYGDRYRIIDPKDWPRQAKLANKDDWTKLIKLQAGLGSRKSGGNTASKAEKLLKRFGYINKYQKDNLKIIEGIGPKIEGLLHEAGIKTWEQLGEAKTPKLKSILESAGKRYQLADPTTWPKQARLADKGDFAGLEEFQDQLKGGRSK